jgi:hypothetical protein
MKKLIIIILIISSCSKASEIKDTEQKQTNTKEKRANQNSLNSQQTKTNNIQENNYLSDYKLVHTLRDRNGQITENIYVKPLNDSIFINLIITPVKVNNFDTLYYIEKNLLRNKKGVDIEVSNEDLKGYKLVMKKDKYITLVCVDNNLQESSDYLTIEKNNTKQLFEVQTAP